MDFFLKLRRLENLHIVFWIIKDTCWLLEWQVPGTIMVVPTVFLAAYMVKVTTGHREFFLNCAVLCWITANSTWMLLEFYNNDEHKNIAIIPFVLGLIAITVFYARSTRQSPE